MSDKPAVKAAEKAPEGTESEEKESGWETVQMDAALLSCALKASVNPNGYDFDPYHGHEAQKWPDGTVRLSIKLKGNSGHKITYAKIDEKYPMTLKTDAQVKKELTAQRKAEEGTI